MIRRFSLRNVKLREGSSQPKGYDDFRVRLGDTMRGERATMGKSLLDVQRDLRIKASYIAAIENCDPTTFDTPGFIAGYVRSYARYLNMDPEDSFTIFCEESGFSVAHGMSEAASGRRPQGNELPIGGGLGRDAFVSPSTPYIPSNTSLLASVDLRAVGSVAVLLAVIAGLGYGGWRVLHEVQQVTFAPVDQTPNVLADLDPLDAAVLRDATQVQDTALDRLYRPQALDVPVLVARDAPISTLDPREFGNFARTTEPNIILTDVALPNRLDLDAGPFVPKVIEDLAPSVTVLAVRPSWVQIKAESGSVIFETIMEPGQSYEVPSESGIHYLGTGESSGIYFAVNGHHYGPVGSRGAVTKNIDLSPDGLTDRFEVADLDAEHNQPLAVMVAQLGLEAQSDTE